ncbi:hypothetical protein E3N88_11529 [Mikania micrantha]|uniref:Reverse transcriptase Ty1/copia-type domain-containing protein n=1 Tax=Mikania micrantha TaxID=192012 RepID=A0A5N6PEQ5_9ASTR|nr:hypothetical protein E3N88_11529 [Mikania micrantha]
MDVKTAFLNGDLYEDVFMKQPEGFMPEGQEHLVCKLKKSIYGLKQASRQWYLKFDEVMKKHGFLKNQCPKTEAEKAQMRMIPYASVVGSLMYAQVCTRPDIAYIAGMLSRYQTNPGLDHLKPAWG